MLLTRETDYALRVLHGLMNGELKTAGELSEQELIPQAFAYKIIRKLSNSGWVQITRGTEGGCRLAADLGQISLYDLLAALDCDHSIVACMEPGHDCSRREAHGCNMHGRLLALQLRLDNELRSHSLLSLLTDDK